MYTLHRGFSSDGPGVKSGLPCIPISSLISIKIDWTILGKKERCVILPVGIFFFFSVCISQSQYTFGSTWYLLCDWGMKMDGKVIVQLKYSRKLKNVGFYIALFQYWPKRFTFNFVAIRILSVALQCPRHTHTFGQRSMDNIPSKYLITLRSQSRPSICPRTQTRWH